MTARPIIFSAPMIRALLAGEKTQTRRIVKCRDGLDALAMHQFGLCPYGQPGDLLYVKETHQYAGWTEDGKPLMRYRSDESTKWCEGATEAVIDIWATLSEEDNYAIDQKAADRRWRPSIHMPRWASRLTLRITDVRVQRLQEISEAEARAEGVTDGGCINCGESEPCGCTNPMPCARDSFISIWYDIHGPASWLDNPYVWALTFDVIRQNVDEVTA